MQHSWSAREILGVSKLTKNEKPNDDIGVATSRYGLADKSELANKKFVINKPKFFRIEDI